MRKLSFALLLAIIMIISGCRSPFKTIMINGSMPEKDQATLIGESEVIVLGTVKEILPSKWITSVKREGETQRTVLQTDVMVDVEQSFKGSSSVNTVAIRLDRGKTKYTEVISEVYPDFEPGEI